MAGKQLIHEEVQKHYGAIASAYVADSDLPVAESCCAPSASGGGACNCNSLYDNIQLADLPDSVTALSLGCGDPVTIASLKPGETVLDLGSGAGIDCFLAAREVGPTGRVIGVDMTPAMLAKAQANKAKMGADNVEFREGLIEALPVEENSVDVIMSNCVINLSPDKAAVFRESFRVLKPGGRISVSDIVTEGEIAPAYQKMMNLWSGCVSGAIDMHDYMSLMREAGFEDVSIRDKAEHFEPVAKTIPGAPRVFSARLTGRKP